MAIFRKIHTSFWGDSFIQDLTPEQKYFFLYLLTNDKTKQCGIYEITLRQMCYDTGYNEETVKKLLEFFIFKGKIRYSEKSKEVALSNWLKYNDSSSPKVKSCVNKELEKVKDRLLIQYIYSIETHPQEEQEVKLNILFDDFWVLYDKKVGERKKLEKKWASLSNQDRIDIMNHIPLYKIAQPEKKYRKPLPAKPYGYDFKISGLRPEKYVYSMQSHFGKEYRNFSMTSSELYTMDKSAKDYLFNITKKAYIQEFGYPDENHFENLRLLRIYNSRTMETLRSY